MQQQVKASQPVMPPQPLLSTDPMQVTCGNCHQVVMTTVVKENGPCAYIWSIFVCMVCCPCFWIPLCMDSCKDVHHSCPSCGTNFGTRRKT